MRTIGIRALRPGQPFRDDRHERECECHGEHEDACRLERLAARSKNDENAREPGKNRHQSTACHRFVQKRNRQDRDPGWRRELEREDGCERQEGEGVCPAIGSGEMQDVAKQMQLDPSWLQLRTQLGSEDRESEKQDNAQSVADGKDFEDR